MRTNLEQASDKIIRLESELESIKTVIRGSRDSFVLCVLGNKVRRIEVSLDVLASAVRN